MCVCVCEGEGVCVRVYIRCGAAMEFTVSLTAAPPSEVVGTSAWSKEGEGKVRIR